MIRAWLRTRRANRRHRLFFADYQLTEYFAEIAKAPVVDSVRIVPLIVARQKVTV